MKEVKHVGNLWIVLSLNQIKFTSIHYKYNQVVSQRNALLKYFAANFTYDPTTLAVYNEQLIDLGTKIHAKRSDFMLGLTLFFKNIINLYLVKRKR